MKLIIILLIISSTISYAQNKEGDKKVSLAMANLNDLNLISLPCTREYEVFDENEKGIHYMTEEFRRSIMDSLGEGTLKKVANNLDCDTDCQKNYEILRSKMNFKNMDQYFYQDIYDSIEMNNVVGQLISTCPLTVKYSNNFYTNENWKEDYKTIEDNQVFNYSGVYNRNEFAMWVYQLKKFIYLKNSALFYGDGEEPENKIINNTCSEYMFYNGFVTNIKLFDKNGKVITRNDLKDLELIKKEKLENGDFRFYFLNKNKTKMTRTFGEKRNEKIDGSYLLTYYNLVDYIVYSLPKDQILNSEGQPVFYKTFINPMDESTTLLYCPDEIEASLVMKLKKGELEFKDLPDKYRDHYYRDGGNLLYKCRDFNNRLNRCQWP